VKIEPNPEGANGDEINEKARAQQDAPDHNALIDKEILGEASRGEELAHNLITWDAAKTHPVACFWAFFICFTIVSCSSQRE
jgi:SP family general alpha glucoside:H+ symporter-like MFS transporter